MLCLLCNTAQAADNNKVLSEENKILVWKNFKNRHFFVISDEKRHWSMRRLSHHYFEDDRIYILCGYRNLNHVNHECPFYIFSWHSATNCVPFILAHLEKLAEYESWAQNFASLLALTGNVCVSNIAHSPLALCTVWPREFVVWG